MIRITGLFLFIGLSMPLCGQQLGLTVFATQSSIDPLGSKNNGGFGITAPGMRIGLGFDFRMMQLNTTDFVMGGVQVLGAGYTAMQSLGTAAYRYRPGFTYYSASAVYNKALYYFMDGFYLRGKAGIRLGAMQNTKLKKTAIANSGVEDFTALTKGAGFTAALTFGLELQVRLNKNKHLRRPRPSSNPATRDQYATLGISFDYYALPSRYIDINQLQSGQAFTQRLQPRVDMVHIYISYAFEFWKRYRYKPFKKFNW